MKWRSTRSPRQQSIARVAAMLNKFPDRFLFGTDTVAPAGAGAVLRRVRHVGPVWRQLTPEASLKVRKGNYERMFDEGRQPRPRMGTS